MRLTSIVRRVARVSLAGAIFAGTAAAQGASSPTSPSAKRLTQMGEAEQTSLALAAAPAEVTSHASVYVLKDGRYVRTRTGTNGFSCLIEREFLETYEPVCYDAEGSATTMVARFRREELRARGLSESEVRRRIDAAYRSGRLHAPRKPGIVYMLSDEQMSYNPGTKKIWNAPPHFMLYAPYAKQSDMGGAPGPRIPFIAWPGQPDALMILMAPSGHGH